MGHCSEKYVSDIFRDFSETYQKPTIEFENSVSSFGIDIKDLLVGAVSWRILMQNAFLVVFGKSLGGI